MNKLITTITATVLALGLIGTSAAASQAALEFAYLDESKVIFSKAEWDIAYAQGVEEVTAVLANNPNAYVIEVYNKKLALAKKYCYLGADRVCNSVKDVTNVLGILAAR